MATTVKINKNDIIIERGKTKIEIAEPALLSPRDFIFTNPTPVTTDTRFESPGPRDPRIKRPPPPTWHYLDDCEIMSEPEVVTR
ncbi:hypothetical protein ACHWQZ_G017931 [Mnemiopsis leidyi]